MNINDNKPSGSIYHDLRGPLAVIKEAISLLLDDIPGKLNEEQKSLLLTAQRNIEKLKGLIDGLEKGSRRG